MTNKLQITQLDFDSIKVNLKNYLRSQSEFQDYDFTGSGLDVLLDVLAYNTHYNAYYLNMVANESFLDTAIIRDSVVSHAKTLGYTPYSRKASTAIVDITVPVNINNDAQITLPRGFSFKSEIIDNTTYNFSLLDDYVATHANGNYYFENIPISEGTFVEYNFTNDESNNPKAVFTIPDKNIDIGTIKVLVRDSISNTDVNVYTLSTSLLEVGSESQVYWLQESSNMQYQLYFGNGVLGKKLAPNAIVTVSYLVTAGSDANKLKIFTATSKVGTYITYTVNTISESTGGDERQDIDDIKFAAITQYSTQDRLVSIKDYEVYIKKEYPVIDSLSIWGGEEQTPKIFGKIFICLKPKDDYYISEAEKTRILNDIIIPKSIITVTPEILDPEYLFILITTHAHYNKTKTSLTDNQLINAIRNRIIAYNNQSLNKFKASLLISRLQDEIDSADSAIYGNDITLRVQKRFTPVLNTKYNYNVNFNLPIKKGSSTSKLTSTEFTVNDSDGIPRNVTLEEVPNSETGISSVIVTSPGVGYTSTPTITITGDGTGATATATIVNGKIESINIVTRGINYTKAVVNISGGGGTSAAAVAVIDSKVGELRTVYYNNNAERITINTKAGTINYDLGQVIISDINILDVSNDSKVISVTIESESGMIESNKNTILYIDGSDSSSIQISVQSV